MLRFWRKRPRKPTPPAPAPAPAPAPTPAPTPTPAPAPAVVLSESLTGTGVFVSQADFYSDPVGRGASKNPDWACTGGEIVRTADGGRITDRNGYFRMWTRRSDLPFVRFACKVRFSGWYPSDGSSWHGLCVMLNRAVAVLGDLPAGEEAGYFLDYNNRGGYVTILKKVPGDTTARWPYPGAHYTMGGTYYEVAKAPGSFQPVPGEEHIFAGQVTKTPEGHALLQVERDGVEVLRYLDDGRHGGPPLTYGRVGVRADFMDVTLRDLVITRR